MNLKVFVNERLSKTLAIIYSILLDALIFCFWVMIAWVMHLFSDFLISKGISDEFAFVFQWFSSLSTLILTILYLVIDIKQAIKDVLSN